MSLGAAGAGLPPVGPAGAGLVQPGAVPLELVAPLAWVVEEVALERSKGLRVWLRRGQLGPVPGVESSRATGARC